MQSNVQTRLKRRSDAAHVWDETTGGVVIPTHRPLMRSLGGATGRALVVAARAAN
jgi:hypothetical protein